MILGLKKYTDFYVKPIQKIKGNYGFRIILNYEDGSTKTQQQAGFLTIDEAEKFRDLTKVELEQRTYLVYGSVLFKEYVYHWLEDDIKERVKSYNTYYSYKSVVEKHIIPVIGNKMMRMINSADIYRLYDKVSTFSKSIAKQTKVIMNTCLELAVEERAVKVNMASGVGLPRESKNSKHHTRELDVNRTLTHEQIMKLIEGSKGSPIHLMILLNVILGLRCSEIIGLKYSDVDFIQQKLHIRRQLGRDIKKDDDDLPAKTYTKQEIQLKTESSSRIIDIPDIVYDAILQQRKNYQSCKKRRSTRFQDMGYICCSSYGRPRSKNYHFKEFKRLLKELDLPDVRWHDLRGTCATQLLLAGISPKAVAKNLGHAKEIVTCNNYVDNAKLTVLKLERLDTFIASVVPEQDIEQKNDFSNVRIDISEYISQ